MKTIRLIIFLQFSLFIIVSGLACEDSSASTRPDSNEPETRIPFGEPRMFRLGFGDSVREVSTEKVSQNWDRMSENAEAIVVNWQISTDEFDDDEFSVSQKYGDKVLALKAEISRRDLDLILVIDIFDTSGDEIGLTPSGPNSKWSDDNEFFLALDNELKFLARNVSPWALILGNQINLAFESNPDLYFLYAVKYRTLYRSVKSIDSSILVAPSFAYEEFMGIALNSNIHPPRWELLTAYEDVMDIFAISTFPSFVYPTALSIPSDYYSSIRQYTDAPLFVLQAGFHVGEGYADNQTTTLSEQRRYLERLFDEADDLGALLVSWYLLQDSALFPYSYRVLGTTGLYDNFGEPKPSWTVWSRTNRRPMTVPSLN